VSVGETLREAREARGLSIEDVSADTRIRGTLIRGIEDDNFAPCGGAVYARGHIRSISRIVGVDPAPLVAEFDRANDVPPPAPTATTDEPSPTDRAALSRSDRRRGPNWPAAMVATVVLVIVLAVVGVLHKSHSPTSNTASPPTTATQQTSHPPRTPTSTPPSSAVGQLPAANEATMLVKSTRGRTWISVSDTRSGGTLFQGILEQGRQKLFSDKHGLTFIIGNAPAVDVVVNGHDIGSPASANDVSRGQIVPGSNTVQKT
jgi:cytoskeletal protein RodZ